MSLALEAYGWIAASGAMLGFGSTGVPIKSDAAMSVDIDPLVFQSYRVATCFLTCWLVLAFGQDFVFTPWGIVSGIFWVPAGSAAIFAVQTAGLATSMGIGSSFAVLVSFTWGILLFQEPVSSKWLAFFAVSLMVLGISGMSYYLSPQAAKKFRRKPANEHTHLLPDNDATFKGQASKHRSSPETVASGDVEGKVKDVHDEEEEEDASACNVLGRKIPKRTLGICAAIFRGCWGGSMIVPMHWAPPAAKGAPYVISFAIGASTVLIVAWCVLYVFLLIQTQSPVRAYKALPAFHFRTIWQPGALSGLLWSFGNFCSILSVHLLGVGVGYSVIQAAMIVSGLWGICYYREAVGAPLIAKWFASVLTTMVGILLLGYTHEAVN